MSGHHPWREIKHKKDAAPTTERLEAIRLGWCVDAAEAEPESRTAIHDFHSVFKAYDALAAELATAQERAERFSKPWLCDCHTWPDPDEAHAYIVALEERVTALPSPDRLREIADLLDFFDKVLEIADAFLPGEREHYRAVDHTEMQDDLRRAAAALEGQ